MVYLHIHISFCPLSKGIKNLKRKLESGYVQEIRPWEWYIGICNHCANVRKDQRSKGAREQGKSREHGAWSMEVKQIR